MTKLKVPSLQHLARNWKNDSNSISRKLVSTARSAPPFTYDMLFKLVRDKLIFDQPTSQLIECIYRAEKREKYRDDFIAIFKLVTKYFENINPDYVHAVNSRMYPIGRGLMVPFRPPLIYGSNLSIYFPWFSFWKNNPLNQEQLALFVTIVDEILLQDPDLENACFHILDFSAPGVGEPRELTIIDANKIERVSEERKIEMLEIFVEGYFKAEEILAVQDDNYDSHDEQYEDNRNDPNQLQLLPPDE